MRWPNRIPAPIRFALVVLLAIILSTCVDPYLRYDSPLAAQAVDAVIPVIVVLLVWAISGRAWLALVAEIVVLGVLWYADLMKVMYLDTDLVYADLTVLGGLLADPHLVLGFLHPTWKKVTATVLLLFVVVAVAWITRRRQTAGWRFRLVCLGLAAGGVVAIATQRVPDSIPALGWEVYGQPTGADAVGIAGNILLGRMTARDVERPPDPKLERAFWNEPLVQQARQRIDPDGGGVRPDIVIVQSESLFEPSQLCGFTDTPVLRHLAAQQPDLPGNLKVPVFGGRTLQTEFEVLAGAPISFYPGSMFAYYELIHHPFNAFPRVLDDLGYDTVLVHPNARGFWRRGKVMPQMGFDTFQDADSFLPRDYTARGHVSDMAMTRAILSQLDSSNRPTFAMGISINNHGPWGQYAPRIDSDLGLPAKLTGEARVQMADYVAHAIDADDAYGYLLDALKRRGRPTVVVLYGDHLPALPAVYDQLCFKDGKAPEDHDPPYRIWANFPMPKPPPVTSAYLLQGWLMHVAGLPMKGQVLANYLAGVVAHDPSADATDRKRILDEYANIAAANVAAKVPPRKGVGHVFVGSDQALNVLMGKAPKSGGRPLSVDATTGDLDMHTAVGSASEVAFEVDDAIASLTLHPYMTNLACQGDASQSKIWFSVTGDGHELYRAWLTHQALRLATLDLEGVKRLSLQVKVDADASSACGQVYVQVPQMLCYATRCGARGPTARPAYAALPSRILSEDPMPGDIAALNRVELARGGVRMQNLKWLLARERGAQTGYGNFGFRPGGQLRMAPGDDRDAWIDFDVTGVQRILVSPRVAPLGPDCQKLQTPAHQIGVVKLSVALDGKPLVAGLTVDSSFAKALPLDVTGGHTIRVSVSKAGDVSWCDRFSIGFPLLEGSNVPDQSTAGEPAAAAATGGHTEIPTVPAAIAPGSASLH